MKKRPGYIMLFLIIILVSCLPVEVTPSISSNSKANEATEVRSSLPETTVSPTVMAVTSTHSALLGKPLNVNSTPTLTSKQIQQRVLDLLKTNANCNFPCWWGLMPGDASYDDINRLLEPLSGTQPFINGNFSDLAFVEYGFPIPNEMSPTNLQVRMTFKDKILQDIKVYPINWKSFQLSNLLENYGVPNEVWLHTYSSEVEPVPPFALYLYYPDLGILAYFPSQIEKNEVQVGVDKITGCVSTSATLFFWSPVRKLSFDEAGKKFNVEIVSQTEMPKLPLEAATSMTVQEFYKRYKDSKQDVCIETPIDLWPSY